jgi:hypothetical protein
MYFVDLPVRSKGNLSLKVGVEDTGSGADRLQLDAVLLDKNGKVVSTRPTPSPRYPGRRRTCP